ncbi:glucose-6-phosphate dehydrogenase [Lichtheimia ornata]|uniref:Glucose-6-phosphate 1-dehydrogenase n=1 Tax=Lichtheimia ornata TaxID=688661 RepID=A0AAD7V7Y1_9FUNG|nr:glucose-6-phosphate dehydrogenase [Lichtheimia ornata]KAJ8660674.1 glucose-6-phosphate dehydrogenase [Lichtheimia ornata]
MSATDIQQLKDQVHENMQGAVTIVVLGASGDLAGKKTYPAIFSLLRNGLMPENVHVTGYARSKLDRDEYVKRITAHLKDASEEDKNKFLEVTDYVSGQYDQDDSWKSLNEHLDKLEEKRGLKEGRRNRVFYMALPPSVFVTVARGLRKFVYTDKGHNRIVVEKPFGKDLESSTELAKDLGELFKEDEIYRIDHYLGKEMVKNILPLRFANMILDPTFCNKTVDNVQITLKEPFGTEGRGGYFDEYNIIRDVMQNHLLQVMSLIAMDKPAGNDPESTRDAKVKLLRKVKPIDIKDTLLGQYVANGDKPGYKDDDTVPNDSVSPTFAALVLYVDNDRWRGVPFIMKAGKALDTAKVDVRLQFRDVEEGLFKQAARNELVLRIQPGEAIYYKLNNKSPGLTYRQIVTDLDLTYKDRYKDMSIPDAYETLILDVMRSDHSNFVRDDELDAAWRIFTPLLHKIDREKIQPKPYPYGSRGPQELDDFVTRYGFKRDTKAPYEWPVQSVGK